MALREISNIITDRHCRGHFAPKKYVYKLSPTKTSAPIGAWKGNFRTYDRPTDRPTDGHEGSQVTLQICNTNVQNLTSATDSPAEVVAELKGILKKNPRLLDGTNNW